MEYRLIWELQEFLAIRISFILLICLFSSPLLSHYSCYNLLSVNVHMLVSALILCEKLQPWKLKCSIFSLCSCALCPDFIQAAGLGWAETSAEDLGKPSSCYLRNCCWGANFTPTATQPRGWVRLDPFGPRSLPSLRSWDCHWLRPVKGQENATFWVGLWGFSWITAETGCATGWPRAGESSASQMQFVVGGLNHPRKTRRLLVSPGCPPCFASGHSATAARCWQHKPTLISAPVPLLVICSS